MAIQWNDEYSVNVKEIDKQHKNYFDILNKMYDFIYKQKSQSELKKVLDVLLEYADVHFKTEEEYFDKFNYKNSAEHKKEHQKFRDQMAVFYKKFAAGDLEITMELIDFLEDWLVYHVDLQDKKYIKCFNKHGLF